MTWDQLPPVAGVLDRSGVGAPVVAPFGSGSFGDVGPGAGVGAAQQITDAIAAAASATAQPGAIGGRSTALSGYQSAPEDFDSGAGVEGNDSSAAINAAIAALPSTPDEGQGGRIALRPGRIYDLAGTVLINRPGTDLGGSGFGGTWNL